MPREKVEYREKKENAARKSGSIAKKKKLPRKKHGPLKKYRRKLYDIKYSIKMLILVGCSQQMQRVINCGCHNFLINTHSR